MSATPAHQNTFTFGPGPTIKDVRIVARPSRADQILERFQKFHAANPEVWKWFKQFTRELIAAGRTSYSGSAIIHRIRWETQITTTDREPCKINDHYMPYYSRMFLACFPEHKGFFHTRNRKSERMSPRSGGEFSPAAPSAEEETLMATLRALAGEGNE